MNGVETHPLKGSLNELVVADLRVHKINRIPVVDGERLIGVVTRGDVLAAIAHLEHHHVDPSLPPVVIGSAGMHPGLDGDRRASRTPSPAR